jgi:hypothetical protein
VYTFLPSSASVTMSLVSKKAQLCAMHDDPKEGAVLTLRERVWQRDNNAIPQLTLRPRSTQRVCEWIVTWPCDGVQFRVLKFREVWLWRNFGGTYADLWQNLWRTSASWLRSLSLLDPSTERQRAGKLTIDVTFLVP